MDECEMVRRNVTLDENTIATLKRVAQDRRLGSKGFSAALRIVVQEWEQLNQMPKRVQTAPSGESKVCV